MNYAEILIPGLACHQEGAPGLLAVRNIIRIIIFTKTWIYGGVDHLIPEFMPDNRLILPHCPYNFDISSHSHAATAAEGALKPTHDY